MATVLSQLTAPSRTPDSGDGWTILTYLLIIVPAGAGLIGTAQIGRANTVPAQWRWAPLGAFLIHPITWALTQALYATLTPATIQEHSSSIAVLNILPLLIGTLGLGIVALLATAPNTVRIYPSSCRPPPRLTTRLIVNTAHPRLRAIVVSLHPFQWRPSATCFYSRLR